MMVPVSDGLRRDIWLCLSQFVGGGSQCLRTELGAGLQEGRADDVTRVFVTHEIECHVFEYLGTGFKHHRRDAASLQYCELAAQLPGRAITRDSIERISRQPFDR